MADDERTRSLILLTNGAEVSHYKIISKIGAGGMGEVYLAEDAQLDRKVALKFLPRHLCQDQAARARFTREAKAAAKLDHPNIVQVYEVGEFQGRPFFAMAHVEGKSLGEVVKEGKLSISEAIEHAKQICEGLHKAHELGVVHRDIKPGNIIIDRDNKARVLDFGLAAVAGEDKLTKTGSTLGTIGYMSPEQIEGKQADHRSDLFSVGVILYEMLAGRRPFEGDNDAAIARSITDTIPEPVARYKSGTTGELQQIIDKALSKDPVHRYQHTDELLADLRRLSLPGKTKVRIRELNRWVAIAAVALLFISVALYVFKLRERTFAPAGDVGALSKRIAIVPFRNQTGDSTLNAWGRLVSDWTSQSLVQARLGEVISSEALTGLSRTEGVRAIVDATDADILVTGSYYRISDSVQFQAQIVGADEKLIHAIEPVGCSPDAMDKAVNLLRQRIVGGLAVFLDKKLSGTLPGESSPPTYEAYQEYVLGFDAFHIRSDWREAIEHYRRAYENDTSFLEPLVEEVPAYMNIGQYARADSLLQFLNQRRSRLSYPMQLAVDLFSDHLAGNFPESMEDCKQLAKLLPGSHASFQVGFLAAILNLPREAIGAFKTVNPDAGWAQYWPLYWTNYALAYHVLGDHKKELELAREGKRRFPNSRATYDAEIRALAALGRVDELKKGIDEFSILYEAGTITGYTPGGIERDAALELRAHGFKEESAQMFAEAIDWFKRKAAIQPSGMRWVLALTLVEAGRWSEGGDLMRQLEEDFPSNVYIKGQVGFIAAHEGDKTGALQICDWLENYKAPYLFGSNLYECARIKAALGEQKEAVVLLKKACAQGYGAVYIHSDPAFESLLDYPPFVEFLKPKG